MKGWATGMGGPPRWVEYMDRWATRMGRPQRWAGHWDKRATGMDGSQGLKHWDGWDTGMDKPLGWAGYRDGQATGISGPSGNGVPLRIGQVIRKWPGLICQLHKQRRVPQLVSNKG